MAKRELGRSLRRPTEPIVSNRSATGGKVIVAVGAHPDDIEIGCGGSVAYHSGIGDKVICVYLTNGEKTGDKDVRAEESRRACKILGVDDVIFLGFEDTNIPQSHGAIEDLDAVIEQYRPQRVYTHSLTDFHQDHRGTAEISMAACRNIHQILSYEGPRVSAHFTPNYFVDISDFLDIKRRALQCHVSQKRKYYMTHESMLSLASFRGRQVHTRFAEAFEAIRYLENPRHLKTRLF